MELNLNRKSVHETRETYDEFSEMLRNIEELDKWEDLNREDGTVESVRPILKVGRLYDVSAVSLPANDATSISVRSLSDGVTTRLEAERLHAEEIRKAKLALKIQILREEF